MLNIVFILALLFIPSPPYTVGDVRVYADVSCDRQAVITRQIVALTAHIGPRRYRIPGLDAWPTVSLLSAQPGAVSRDGDVITWEAHAAGATIWVIVGGLPDCPVGEVLVEPLYDQWLPLALK